MQEARSVTISSNMTIKRPSDTSETDRKPKSMDRLKLRVQDKECEVQLMNQKRGLILLSLRHLLFMTILSNIKGVNEIMRFLYPKYRRNRLTAQRAGGGYNDQFT